MANTSGSSSESEKGSARKEEEKDTGANSGTRSAPVSGKAKMKWPKRMQWIPANWTWPKMKPVIRCAIACWIAVVLFVIPKIEIWMGNASFLVIIASILSPPNDPFVATLEREILIVGLAATGWGWGCLGIFLANLARIQKLSPAEAPQAAIFSGEYIEAAPSVIIAVFIFLGSAFMLYIRVRMGGPYLFATIFGCLTLDIFLTTGALFPYPAYTLVGKTIIIPLGLHSCIAVVCSVLIFPSTVSGLFTFRLQGVLSPLVDSFNLHRNLLNTDPSQSPEEFASTASSIKGKCQAAENALIPLAVSGRLLESDLVYSRFAPSDFRGIQKLARKLVGRAQGMTSYFGMIDPTREKFPSTPMTTRPATPILTSPPSPERERSGATTPTTPVDVSIPVSREMTRDDATIGTLSGGDGDSMSLAPTVQSRITSHTMKPRSSRSSHIKRHSHGHAHTHSHLHSHHSQHHRHTHLMNNSLLHISIPTFNKSEGPVGVFESSRYVDIETSISSDRHRDAHIKTMMETLHKGCDPLLRKLGETLGKVNLWLENARRGRTRMFKIGKVRKEKNAMGLEEIREVREEMKDAYERFREAERHAIIEPYRCWFAAHSDGLDADDPETPHHRYLFHCFVYQYHLGRFSSILLEMLDEILRLEEERKHYHLWTPVSRIFKWADWHLSEGPNEDEEDPDTVQGLEPAVMDDLGIAKKRDPDYLPPRNAFEWAMSHLFGFFESFKAGNALYAVKAGLLTAIIAIPALLKGTAAFAYQNRFVWALFMSQLTIARFRGDTAFGLVARIVSTFIGGILGMVMWYISTGNGLGNAFGLAAVCAVFFPFMFFARLYWPYPPMTMLILLVTSALVFGYSYQDHHIKSPGNPGVGVEVAWRRFVLVTCGVTAAFIFSLIPPSTTIRRYQRATLATTATELAAIYCAVLSYSHSRTEEESQEISIGLLAIRSKLNRSAAAMTNVVYEVSLRGQWPADRYSKIMELQLQLASLLSHFMSIVGQLELNWTRAMFTRMRLLDPDFQGEVLAVMTMISTSLRTGTPLPQITPCPLLDKVFTRNYEHGFNITRKEAEEDFGLPRVITIDTLQDVNYLMFSVGVSTACGILRRLDRLMLATKEIVGEQYHIHGVGTLPPNFRSGDNTSIRPTYSRFSAGDV